MRKLFQTAVLIICSATLAAAQAVDGYHRFEVFNGYSYFMLERPEPIGEGTRLEGFHGINTTATFNVKRYFGLQFDFSRHSKRSEFCAPDAPNLFDPKKECFALIAPPEAIAAADDPHIRTSIYNFMGGVQLKDNGKNAKLLKPFAHLVIGSALTRESAPVPSADPMSGQVVLESGTVSDWGPAGAIGGGLDIKLSDRIDLRAVQVDYHKATIFARSTDNLRFGVGLVFR
ncbi:MAG TPA: hypothetical protein VJT74_16105 [Pyrinomonadaceae bacterium]|nr:hypothetical protein [Pyrinomonadaceae bacterium]